MASKVGEVIGSCCGMYIRTFITGAGISMGAYIGLNAVNDAFVYSRSPVKEDKNVALRREVKDSRDKWVPE